MKKGILMMLLTAGYLLTSTAQPIKKVLLEDFTANWTGFATRGFAVRDSIVNANPGTVILVSLHYSDPMATTQSEAIADQFNVNAFPTGMVDRKVFAGQSIAPVNTNLWGGYVSTRLAQNPALSIDITSNYNTGTRISNVHVKATFVTAKTATMKFHLFYVEDSVSTPGVAYNQENYYGAGCSFADPANPYYNYPCVIPNFVYRYMFRYAASPVLGSGGIIPVSVSPGDTFSVNYTYTLPPTFNENRMKLVAFVSTTDNSVLNAESVPMVVCNCNLNATTLITNVSGPTCANGKIKVSISGAISTYPRFELYDASSNLISFFNAPPGTVNYTFTNLTPGSYQVKVKDGGGCCLVELTNKTVKCPAPSSGFLTNNITANSAKVKWNVVGCTAGYQVQYRVLGTTSWTTKTTTVTNKILNNLSPSTTYQWKVATKCFGSSPAVYSTYSAVQTFTTSPLREGENSPATGSEPALSGLHVFPNPAVDNLEVGFHTSYTKVVITVMNTTGQTVFKKEIEADEENVSVQLDISKLSRGMYSLLISNENAVQTKRFIKH